MQRRQLLTQIDRQLKKWQREINHNHSSDDSYRAGFSDGVNKVKELINGALLINNKHRRKK